ncbi:MAG: hypothetical protein GEU88_17490 [Solirubrobacterales bacterium]|nr:hypothetical protein [Solirubrobacterales bacterium]
MHGARGRSTLTGERHRLPWRCAAAQGVNPAGRARSRSGPRAPSSRGRAASDERQPRRGHRAQPHADALRRRRPPAVSEPAFDQLLRRLSEADVEFVLVGGLAVNAWGVVRGTKDVDVVVAPGDENLGRVAAVAVAARGHVQVGEAFLGSAPSIAARLAEGEQVAIETGLGRLDIVQGLDGVPPYAELRARAEQAQVLGVSIAVCSLEDLRAMKRATGRARDIADLEDLEAVGD